MRRLYLDRKQMTALVSSGRLGGRRSPVGDRIAIDEDALWGKCPNNPFGIMTYLIDGAVRMHPKAPVASLGWAHEWTPTRSLPSWAVRYFVESDENGLSLLPLGDGRGLSLWSDMRA